MRRLALCVSVLICLAAPALTQTATPPGAAPARLPVVSGPVKLTPDLAAQMAVERSTDIALGEQGVEAARAYLQQARALTGLDVALSASFTRMGPSTSFELPESMGGGSMTFAPSASHKETLSVTLPVYLGKRDRYARDAARAGVEAAGQGVEGANVQIALAARQTVFGILRLQQLSVVAQQATTAVAEHLRIAQAMFDQGTAPRFEVVQAETGLAEAKGAVVHAQSTVAARSAQLTALLNLPQGTAVQVEEGVPAAMPDGDLQQLIQTALESRPEVEASQAQIRSAEANLRLAEAADNVSVALLGNLNNQTASAASDELNWNLSVAVSKPLFRGGQTEAGVRQARATLETARLSLEKLTQEIALSVAQGLIAVEDARESLKVAEQGEVNARERARIADVRFRNGVGLGVEVLDAQTALASAQTSVINARFELQVAVVSLRAALGLSDLSKESAP